MKKNKIGHYKTLNTEMFPKISPPTENRGETNEERQPTIKEIWEWFGNPDDY